MKEVVASTHEQACEPIRAELAFGLAHNIGPTVAELPCERKPAASARAHANWRPGSDTLRPFLDRVCQPRVANQPSSRGARS